METEEESVANRTRQQRRTREETLEENLFGNTTLFEEEEEEDITTMALTAEEIRAAETQRLQDARNNAVITDPDLINAIVNVMNLTMKSEIAYALFDSGYETWEDMQFFDHAQVDKLMWWPPHKDRTVQADKETPGNMNAVTCLRQFIRYIKTKEDPDNPIWFEIGNFDKTEFYKFRCTPAGKEAVFASAPTTSADRAQVLKEWLKRKRGTTEYEVLNEDSQYPQWLIKFRAIVHTHHAMDVINEKFNPKNIVDTSDQILWQEKQAFMWAVFTKVLQTNIGQYIIKRNLEKMDAREVWFALKKHHTASDAKEIDADTLWKELNSMNFSQESGTREVFCTKFFERIRNYNDISDKGEEVSIQQQARMLKASFLHDVPMQRTYDAMQAQQGVSGTKMVGTTLFEFILSQSKMHDAAKINYTPKGKSN